MEITTRLMEPGEARTVQKIGKRAFPALESLSVTKPKQAVVAVIDGRIAGAVQYKYYRANGRKIGYYDYAFVDPDYHGQGVGGVLYKAAADYLWDQGCDALTGAVKDDNVGSWSLLLKNGFSRISIPELARQFGLTGMLRLWLGTVYGFAVGMDYYVALKDRECPSGKGGSSHQAAAYLLVNLLLCLVAAIWRQKNIGAFFAAFLIFFSGSIAAGYAGTLLSKRRWDFRLCNGGLLICVLVILMDGFFPMAGGWYPDHYENSDQFRKDMGLSALPGWLFVLILALLPALAGDSAIFRYLGNIGCQFLLYRVLAFYPFEAFGGGRVYRWNKGVFFLMSAVSLAVYALS